MSATQQLTPRAREMYPIIQRYLSVSSEMTQKAFCDREGISYSTFQWWLPHFRQPQSPIRGVYCSWSASGKGWWGRFYEPLGDRISQRGYASLPRSGGSGAAAVVDHLP